MWHVVEVPLSLISPAGVRKLGITKFEAKIGQENEASICMFKKLHFKEVQEQPISPENVSNICPVAGVELLSLCVLQVAVNSIFQEVTLRLDVGDQERQWLLEQTNHVEEKSYAELKQPAGVLDT